MRIGELCRRSGIPATTLRYYEALGLIEAPARTSSGYRDYSEVVFDRLAFIRSAQALGLTLADIGRVIALRSNGDIPCGLVVSVVESRIAEIDRTIRDLRALRADLSRLVERSRTLDPADCDTATVCHLIER